MIAQVWKCSVCGHETIGLFPPKTCPECGEPRSVYTSDNELKIPADEIDGVIDACWKVTYGLYMISSVDGERINGQISNTLFQVTSVPPRMAIAINRENYTHELIEKSGVFAASILGRDDHRVIRRFGYRSGRDFDKFKGVEVRTAKNGCPVLAGAVGYFECEVVPEMTVSAGTHTIFIADLTGGGILAGGDPMTYAHYHEVRSGEMKRARSKE